MTETQVQDDPRVRTDVRHSVCPRCGRRGMLDMRTDVCAVRRVNGRLRTCKPSRQWVLLLGGPYNMEELAVTELIPLMALPYEKGIAIHSARYKFENPLIYRFVGSDE